MALKVIGKFSIVQNKRTTKVSWRCFYTKLQNISKFKCYISDTLIQTTLTVASTCNWPRGGNANRVLIRKANIHVRFTWTSFDDRANPTITVKHIHRRQRASAFSSFCVPYPFDPLSCFNKNTKRSILAGALSPVNIVTRRVETDNNVLLQVRDESSSHGVMLLIIQFELIRNVLEFLFQNLKSSIDSCFKTVHFVVN